VVPLPLKGKARWFPLRCFLCKKIERNRIPDGRGYAVSQFIMEVFLFRTRMGLSIKGLYKIFL